MPPKINNRRKNNKPPITAAAAAMVDCVFPHDIMLCILTRLPLKSIHRFKSVCKPWRELFATPKFMKWHHAQFSKDPKNQSVIIYSLNERGAGHTMSLFKIESNKEMNKPLNLDHPYPQALYGMDFVGCVNGFVCMSYPSWGQWVYLWNPASKLYKRIPLAELDFGGSEFVSIGFGYDDEADDFKEVRIGHLGKKGEKMSVGVEVYSAGSNSWRRVKVGFEFSVLMTMNDAIVNGNPYWAATVDENESGRCEQVLVWFDVRKMVFVVVSLSSLDLNVGERVYALVDSDGSVAALVCDRNDEMVVKSLAVWVFDDGGKVWRKNHTFKPLELKVDRFLQCTKNGKILGECPDGKVLVFGPENGGVKEIVIDGARKRSLEICRYSESLAFIDGMEKLVVKKIKEEEEDEDDLDIESYFRKMMLMTI